MKRKILAGAAAAAILILAGISVQQMLGGKKEENVLDRAAVVTTEIVENGTLSSDNTYVGMISAEGTARVVAMVSGRVNSVHVSVGDRVEAGQILCDIDDESARLSLENARQQYETVLANYGGESLSLVQEQLQFAQRQYDRYQALLEAGSISQVEFEQVEQTLNSAETSLKSAQANVRAARGNVESAEYQYSLYHMTAPAAGIVETVNVTGDNFISSGNTAFIISSAEKKQVTFYVTDEVRNALSSGQQINVSSQGNSYIGKISEISGIVDAASGLFQIRAVLQDAGSLPDGLAVDVTVTAHSVEGMPVIPNDALYFENGVSYVYVAANGAAARRDVDIELYTAESAAVSSGISAGDELIISWSAALKDGAEIKIAETEASAEDPVKTEKME